MSFVVGCTSLMDMYLLCFFFPDTPFFEIAISGRTRLAKANDVSVAVLNLSLSTCSDNYCSFNFFYEIGGTSFFIWRGEDSFNTTFTYLIFSSLFEIKLVPTFWTCGFYSSTISLWAVAFYSLSLERVCAPFERFSILSLNATGPSKIFSIVLFSTDGFSDPFDGEFLYSKEGTKLNCAPYPYPCF